MLQGECDQLDKEVKDEDELSKENALSKAMEVRLSKEYDDGYAKGFAAGKLKNKEHVYHTMI